MIAIEHCLWYFCTATKSFNVFKLIPPCYRFFGDSGNILGNIRIIIVEDEMFPILA